MKLKLMAVAVLAVMALVACNKERSTITGSYGGRVLGGMVVMADGSSPAGVEVAVAGTGMRMVVGEDGSFGFANVPERAELLFHRGSLIATLPVAVSDGAVTVELGSNGAKPAGGRRRGAGRGGEKVYETEGVVVSASATELVVFDSHRQEVKFTLTPQTIIRKGNRTLTAADLVADVRVHVKATLADEVRTAVLVIVQDEDDDGGEPGTAPERREFEGIVLSASATELQIHDSHGDDVTFVLDDATVIRKGNQTMTGDDLEEGDRVHVKATTEGTTKTATLVIVQNQKKK